MDSTLRLPARGDRPRERGLTMMIDGGVASGQFRDIVETWHPYLDLVKFGWGTALVTPNLEAKLDTLRRFDIDYFFGGTLFEKYVIQGRFEDFVELCRQARCRYVEVSNGTIPMANHEKASYISKLANEFHVLAEIGYKQTDRDALMRPRDWVRCAHEDLHAGARMVITETRESGTTGLARSDGTLKLEVLEALLDSGLQPNDLLFEAPSKNLQSSLISRIGSDVNLGNVAPTDLAALETLRLGLRSDTLMCFEPEKAARNGALRATA